MEPAINNEAEVKDPRNYVPSGGRRCAVKRSDSLSNWWIGTSPRNGYGAMVEGDWDDWVQLAKNILKADEEYEMLVAAGKLKESTD